jgi:hypothetical protein
MDARAVIAQLQQRVQGQIDGDQLLPDDGAALLTLLERALEGVSVRNAPPASLRSCAQAEIEAFIGRVQALMDAGMLYGADGQPLIEAAVSVRVWLSSAGRSGLEPRREPCDGSRG